MKPTPRTPQEMIAMANRFRQRSEAILAVISTQPEVGDDLLVHAANWTAREQQIAVEFETLAVT